MSFTPISIKGIFKNYLQIIQADSKVCLTANAKCHSGSIRCWNSNFNEQFGQFFITLNLDENCHLHPFRHFQKFRIKMHSLQKRVYCIGEKHVYWYLRNNIWQFQPLIFVFFIIFRMRCLKSVIYVHHHERHFSRIIFK